MQRLTWLRVAVASIAGLALVSVGLYSSAVSAQDAPNEALPICASRDSTQPNVPIGRFCPKLLQVPVFTITNADGSPLVTTVSREDGSSQDVGGVFIDPIDAQNFVTSLQQNQPELEGQVQVSVVTLAAIYETDRENRVIHDRPVEFAYVPSRTQIEQAVAVFEARNQDVDNFVGVPLFFATSRDGGGYMTIEQNGISVIPIFFDKDNLEQFIAEFGGGTDFQNSVQLEVLRLERVLQTMQVLETLGQLDRILDGTDEVAIEATLIPKLPTIMLPEVLAILSQGENSPVAVEIATRLQAGELEGETPIAQVETLLGQELEALIDSGEPSDVWQGIRGELEAGLGSTLEQVVFFPSSSSLAFIDDLLNGTDNSSENPELPEAADTSADGETSDAETESTGLSSDAELLVP